jgi:hypothetical protein
MQKHLLGLLALGLAITLAPATLAQDPPPPAPDLVVTEGHLTLLPDGENFVTREPLRRFSWGHTTENPMKPGARRALGSSTAVGLFDKRTNAGNWLHELPVPILRPGTSDSNQTTFRQNIYLDYGRYWGYICADIHNDVKNEVDEDNNCRWLAPRFYVVPRLLIGTVNGRHFTLAGTISWTGTVTFQLDRTDDPGVFFYKPVDGKLEFNLRYAVGPCTHRGTATLDARASDPFLIRLEFATGQYFMFATPKSLQIPVVQRCAGSVKRYSVPFSHKWLDTGPAAKQFQNPGFTVLDDFFVETAQDVELRYDWNLEPSG